MKFYLRIVLLLLLLTGTLTQDGFDLFDALDDKEPTPAPKPTEKPKANDDFGLDLSEALGPDVVPEKPKKPAAGGDDLNLFDALGPDTNPKPDTPVVNPPKSGGGGGTFGDSDLVDVSGGNYSPDGGHSEGGGAEDSGHNTYGGGENQPEEAGSGKVAGIVSAVAVALLGAASSFIAYQKKKLCFKLQGGADPESGKGQHGQSDPQVFSELLRSS
ncbi:CD99 molecule isoform X1 [Genypterus blacodes]|uniref:CD99 molecule isoform X1 n=1 Tax=Genypterus blacodes TaxID=154954 RepID=UPI003F75C27C